MHAEAIIGGPHSPNLRVGSMISILDVAGLRLRLKLSIRLDLGPVRDPYDSFISGRSDRKKGFLALWERRLAATEMMVGIHAPALNHGRAILGETR